MPGTYFNTDWALNCTSNSVDKFLKVLLEPQELNPQRKGQVWEVVIKAGILMPNDRNPCELGSLQSRKSALQKAILSTCRIFILVSYENATAFSTHLFAPK